MKLTNIVSNKTIKDGGIAPWKDLERFEERYKKRTKKKLYFEMGRIVRRLRFFTLALGAQVVQCRIYH